MPLLLNENAPIDAAIFLLEAALGTGVLLAGFIWYVMHKPPATRPAVPPPPGSQVPWLVVWPALAVVAYLLYLLVQLARS